MYPNKNKLVVSVSPHITDRESIPRIMWIVSLALLPTGLMGIYIFGLRALYVIVTCIMLSLLSEVIIQLLRRQRITVFDGSAFLTGLLLAYNLSSAVPLWLAAVGSVFAIVIGKHVFGGLGQNIFNPALVGRVFLMASWPRYMTIFPPAFGSDAISSATPLVLMKEGHIAHLSQAGLSYKDLLLGIHGGCIGEVSIIALLIPAIYLIYKRYISWHIPFSYILTVAILTYVFAGKQPFSGDVLFHILSGGLILGAFYMATDYVTSPLTKKGQVIFGIGCGIITSVIRIWGGYPEGVSYAILMMNAAVPLIDRFSRPRIYGESRRVKK
jgi:electron transport complex protein RnfD